MSERPTITAEALQASYAVWREELRRYTEIFSSRRRKERALERDRLLALHDGTIEGRNAEQREGAALARFSERYQELWNLEDAEEEAKLDKDVAWSHVKEARALLRLYEIQARLELEEVEEA